MGSFKTIGLVIPDLHNPYYTAFADRFERKLRDHGYDLIVEHSRNNIEFEMHCLESILDRQIDAVTYFVSDFDRHIDFLKTAKKAGKAVVGMTGLSAAEDPFPFDSVEIDFSVGLIDAVEHLLALGHEKFAFLCVLAAGQEAGDRPEVFNEMLKERSIPEANNVFIPCTHKMANVYEVFKRFLLEAGDDCPTALIAMNDLSAIGAIRAAEDAGLRVPEDLSVIGVDNIPLGDYLHRKLTTIEQPIETMAEAAVRMLLKRLSDQEIDFQTMRFDSKLIIKETTAKVRT
ncbi:MAG: substrate-binding domain-containing protein [Puniceicoccaceae bacterium]|nr:substrate-binding domain-containing protein [Puniceicoccaceae bacterium]MBL6912870.1 substrate-binding domain-containing protein [Puniceicoccaceae bacterium]